jgi:hypothetical protein
MHFIHWLTQEYTLSVVTLRIWVWALIVAALAAANGLAVWGLLQMRHHSREADHEMTQAFIREMRLHAESETIAQGREASPDDYYTAQPARAAALAPQPADDGAPLGIHDAAADWEDFPERLERAEDALIAASDPAAFLAWLDADWADYQASVAVLDETLASGAWAATPWVSRRQLAAA